MVVTPSGIAMLEDESVTVRDRDTMEQKRIKIDELDSYMANLLDW